MIYSIEQIRGKIVPIAKKYDIPKVYLFGSYARGDATEASDIDVLIEHRGSTIRGLWDLGAFYLDLNEQLNKSVDVVTLDALEASYTKERSPQLNARITQERISLYEAQ
ncbi:MAG: nucleotidyltransferase domain-containing protein [Oscillospiraceae bacterium]|nr:nucleotidyltransferase domain-containing protein [Oscillospiraceae bacterium]